MRESDTSMPASGPTPVSRRTEIAVYGVGAFSTTMHFMAVTIVPLWVVGLDLSPFLLGIVLGCRPVASLFLSIHIGALMDKVGGRRVMLFFAILGYAGAVVLSADALGMGRHHVADDLGSG